MSDTWHWVEILNGVARIIIALGSLWIWVGKRHEMYPTKSMVSLGIFWFILVNGIDGVCEGLGLGGGTLRMTLTVMAASTAVPISLCFFSPKFYRWVNQNIHFHGAWLELMTELNKAYARIADMTSQERTQHIGKVQDAIALLREIKGGTPHEKAADRIEEVIENLSSLGV